MEVILSNKHDPAAENKLREFFRAWLGENAGALMGLPDEADRLFEHVPPHVGHLVAEVKGNIVWALKFAHEFPAYSRGSHAFRIGPLFVLPEHRRHNVGTTLIRETERHILSISPRDPIVKISLSVTSKLAHLFEWYKRLGYEEVGLDKSYFRYAKDVYLDRYLMTKIITR